MNQVGQEYILNYHLNLNSTHHDDDDDDDRQIKWTYDILYAVQSTECLEMISLFTLLSDCVMVHLLMLLCLVVNNNTFLHNFKLISFNSIPFCSFVNFINSISLNQKLVANVKTELAIGYEHESHAK